MSQSLDAYLIFGFPLDPADYDPEEVEEIADGYPGLSMSFCFFYELTHVFIHAAAFRAWDGEAEPIDPGAMRDIEYGDCPAFDELQEAAEDLGVHNSEILWYLVASGG